MTEAEWLACGDPQSMLAFLGDGVSDRCLRLFVCACCRHFWHRLGDGRSKRSVETTERFVDGLASKRELGVAIRDCLISEGRVRPRSDVWERLAGMTGYWRESLARPEVLLGAYGVAVSACRAVSDSREECLMAANLLRDIFGNLFRFAVFDPSWLAWNGGIISILAQALYDDRTLPAGHLDAMRLPLLGDMLEDAGCTAPQILEHLRGPGPHVRGCWVVDLLLGKL
jgi:hypothetical protein